MQQTRTPLELSGALYGAVRGWVSYEALRKVEEQCKLLAKGPHPAYTGTFSRVWGLPCLHILTTYQDELLHLAYFYTHWHLKRKEASVLLLEPRQRIEPIRAQSSLPRSSTRRKPSQFEVVEAQARHRAPSQCTRCGTVGHTRTSRACPLRYSDIL